MINHLPTMRWRSARLVLVSPPAADRLSPASSPATCRGRELSCLCLRRASSITSEPFKKIEIAVATAPLPKLVADILSADEHARKEASTALEHARRAGKLLGEAKSSMPHGEWLRWLARWCPNISERRAQMYMRVAARWSHLQAMRNAIRIAHFARHCS